METIVTTQTQPTAAELLTVLDVASLVIRLVAEADPDAAFYLSEAHGVRHEGDTAAVRLNVWHGVDEYGAKADRRRLKTLLTARQVLGVDLAVEDTSYGLAHVVGTVHRGLVEVEVFASLVDKDVIAEARTLLQPSPAAREAV